MKMIRSYLYILVATLGLVACSEQDTLTTSRRFTATVPGFEEEGDSRISVTLDASGATFFWTEGDTLGIVPNDGVQTAFPINTGVNSSTAIFDGYDWALRESSTYAAYYPFDLEVYFGTTHQIKVDYSGQHQVGNDHPLEACAYDFLVSPATLVSKNNEVNFAMQHLGCLIRFTLVVPAADQFSKLTLSSATADFAKNCSYDLHEAAPALQVNSWTTKFNIALTDVETTAAGQTVVIYAMMPPSENVGHTWTVTLQGASQTYTGTMLKRLMIASKCYAYSSVLSL